MNSITPADVKLAQDLLEGSQKQFADLKSHLSQIQFLLNAMQTQVCVCQRCKDIRRLVAIMDKMLKGENANPK